MPSTRIASEAIGELVGVATRLEPGVRPVRRREDEQRRRARVEVGAEVARLDALAEERAPALLVAPALGDDLVAMLALEVTPLPGEHRRDVELLGDDAEMTAQRRSHAFDWPRASSGTASRAAWKARAPSRIVCVEELLLRADQRVERPLLNAERLGERVHRRAVETALGEEPRGLAAELVAPA